MKKIIKEVDEKRGIVQVTVADERWYLKPAKDEASGLPIYLPLPSITWIAGYWPKGIGFYKWLAEKGWDEAEAAKQAAGDKGSVVHLAIEMILAGQEFRIDTKVEDKSNSTELAPAQRELTYEELLCVKSFLDWKAEIEKDYVIETLASEKVVISDQHQCAGTVDWVVRFTPRKGGANPLKLTKPTIFVIDFKTSQSIWREYELQISAYAELLRNGENPIRVEDTDWDWLETDDVVDVSEVRTAILQLGYQRNKNKYKFTEVENQFPLFKIARQIWQREVGDSKAGFEVAEFPLVLSPAMKAEAPAEAEPSEPEAKPEESAGEVEPPTPKKKPRK